MEVITNTLLKKSQYSFYVLFCGVFFDTLLKKIWRTECL